jgi:hypothetical protein
VDFVAKVRKFSSRAYQGVFAGILFSGISAAFTLPGVGGGGGGIDVGPLKAVCSTVRDSVPVVAFTMLIIGGLIYAAGQVMGAETRARANVWATALVIGAIIGLVIAASAPFVVYTFANFFTNSPMTGDYTNTC